jgi:hypothetical protein
MNTRKSEVDGEARSQPISRTSRGTLLQFGPAFNDLQQDQEQQLALRVREDQMFAVNFCARCDQYVDTPLRRQNVDAVTLICHLRPHLRGVAQGSLQASQKEGIASYRQATYV